MSEQPQEQNSKQENSISKNMLVNAVMLGLFAIVGTAIVAYTSEHTHDRVVANQRDHGLRQLHQLIPPSLHDNDLDQDVIEVQDKLLGSNQPMKIYRARKDGHPVAAIIECIAPDGYSGKIKLLVGIRASGVLAGVRAIDHMETPGLGDAIETRKSGWIHQFDGKSLKDEPDWRVKRDGGDFDQITSATITSRAVVKASYNALRYFKQHQADIFDRKAGQP